MIVKLSFVILALSSTAALASVSSKPVVLVGTIDDPRANASPRSATLDLRLTGPNVLQNLSISDCRPEELHFWQSCKDAESNFGEVYFYASRSPSPEESATYKLGADSLVYDLKAEGNETPSAELYVFNGKDPASGAVYKMPNPVQPEKDLTFYLKADK